MTNLYLSCTFLWPITLSMRRLAYPPSRIHGFTKDCATCDEGYGSGFQYSCHSCQGSDKWTAIGGAIAVLVVVIFVVTLGVTYLVGVVDRPISEIIGRWERRISSFRDGLIRATPLAAIKILLVSWQIITQVNFAALD